MLPRDGHVPTKRRLDYRPPAFLMPELALEFDLDPDATRVTATFAFRRNPAASATEVRSPLVLDGEHQTDVEVLLDGVALAAPRIVFTRSSLTIHEPPREGTLTIRSTHAPAANLDLEGLYVSSGVFCTQCEPEGFRRITYFADRPDVLATYTVTIRADRARLPVLLSNGNLVATGALDGRPPLRALARSVSQADLPVRAGGGRSRRAHRHVHHRQRTRGAAVDPLDAAQPRMLRARDGVDQARDALGRAELRPRVRPRPLHDLLRRRLQHGRDGEQGPQHLQQPAAAGRAGHGHRRRLRRDRRRDRPRVFPQLDRQSRHVPRLVPAVAEGRPDGLSRSGILGRAGLRRRRAHRRGRLHAAHPVRRGRGPGRTSGAAGRIPGSQQLLHADRLRKRRRGDPHAARAARRRRLPARHGPLLRAQRRPRRHLRRLRAGDERRQRRRPRAIPPLVFPGRHAGDHRRRRLRRGAPPLHARRRAAGAADAGPAGQAAAAHPARRRPRRRRGPRHGAAPRRRRRRPPRRRACWSCARRPSASRSSTCRHARCRRSRADSRRRCASNIRTAMPTSRCSPRTTAIPSIAGTRRSAASAARSSRWPPICASAGRWRCRRRRRRCSRTCSTARHAIRRSSRWR